MSLCESCGSLATKTCAKLDEPALRFCDKCYERHVKEAHPGVELPGAMDIEKRMAAVARQKKKKDLNLIEQAVWDALQNSLCPPEHRYVWPAKSLPCRWCRAAHAVVLVLRKMEAENISPRAMLDEVERLAGWKLP